MDNDLVWELVDIVISYAHVMEKDFGMEMGMLKNKIDQVIKMLENDEE